MTSIDVLFQPIRFSTIINEHRVLPMDLIIKPTEKCNFKCTFCSSTELTEDKNKVLDLDYVRRFVKRFPQLQTIIVNGGDPLVLSPDYYWEMIDILESNGSEAVISLTSNLWDFKLRPEKWVKLFNHPLIGISTSFHYGESRIISENKVFTENDFWEVSNLMETHCNYRPDFISVIDDHNIDRAIDNVRLAKRMNVTCKLNTAEMSGRQKEPLVLADLYEVYKQIIDEGLEAYEYNTQQIRKVVENRAVTCPIARDCDRGIRVLQPDGDYYSCGSFGDNRKHSIDFEKEMTSTTIERPLQNLIHIDTMHEGCYSCPSFQFCNGCRKTIDDHKIAGLVERHCSKMKPLMSDLLHRMELGEL